jgi:hypothetical protein
MGNELDATLSSMLLHDKCPNVAVQEDVKSAKEIECSQYKSTAAIFSSLPFASLVFTLRYLTMSWGHVMHVLDMLWGIRET